MAGNIMGKVVRPLPTQDPKDVILTAKIEKGEEIIEQKFTMKVLPLTHDDVITSNFNLLTDAKILNGNTSLNTISSNLNLITTGENGATISWISQNVSIVKADGTVARPSYTQGDISMTLKATITSGSSVIEKTFNIVVIKLPQTTTEYLEGYWNTYQNTLLGANPHKDQITSNLNIATEAGISITITSDNIARITGAGFVTRPASTDGNASVKLTISLTKDGTVITKTLYVVVLALA